MPLMPPTIKSAFDLLAGKRRLIASVLYWAITSLYTSIDASIEEIMEESSLVHSDILIALREEGEA